MKTTNQYIPNLLQNNSLWIIQAMGVALLCLLYVTRGDISNTYLVLIVLSLLANYWWVGVDKITTDTEIRKHKNALGILFSSMLFIYALQWYLLDQRGVYLEDNQAMLYALSGVLIHVLTAFVFYHSMQQKQIKKGLILERDRGFLAEGIELEQIMALKEVAEKREDLII